jgi:DNA-binding MarR family transcriptional regulator
MQVRPDPTAAVLRSIRRIVRAITLRSKALSRETGLTVPQLLCLRVVAAREDEPPTLADLAREVELSPATITGIVDRLQRAGLVARLRSQADRRKIRVVLTEEGRTRCETLPDVLHERVVARLAALPPADRARLEAALEEVVGLLEAAELDAAPLLTPGERI